MDVFGCNYGFSTSAEIEDLIGFEATLKVSGKPTLVGPA